METSDWPTVPDRDQDAPQLSTLASLLQIVLTEWSNQRQIAANLVATQSDLKALIRSCQNPDPTASPLALARGWRGQSVLPYLQDFLQGKFALRVKDLKSLKPIRLDSVHHSAAEPNEAV